MLDIKFIREHVDLVKKAVTGKRTPVDIDKLFELDEKRRFLQKELDGLKHEQKTLSKTIGSLKDKQEDTSVQFAQIKEISASVKQLEQELAVVNDAVKNILISIPNVVHESVPDGSVDEDNVFVRDWGEKPSFDFKPVPHWEIAEELGILDLKRAAKIAGSGFSLFRGAGALLERALINFMLDFHTREHGYQETAPPFIVKRESMFATGQLPKLEDDMYRIEEDDFFLIPTAEVPLTNIYRDEILSEEDLPVYLVGYTPCFRREAGSYGKDTRGIIRVHQFDKVELVKFVVPEQSYTELESLLQTAETVLQKLGLHYRIRLLCIGDMSFAAAKCYDIEVWAPGQEKYLEVSSCSNFADFQARRGNIRYRDSEGKVQHVHTLNGSGLALPRTVIAIMEAYQTEKGTIRIPDVLIPYMNDMTEISI